MTEEELIPVFDAVDALEALLYRSLLEEAGIDVEERPFESDTFESVRQFGLHSQLLVNAHDAAAALELIKAFREEADHGELRADEPDVP